jgi:hypothetical protein
MAKPQIHPAANIPTPLSDDEYAVLKANIAEYGLLDPITLHKGKVLDGRHRLKACEELGVVPRFIDDDDLAEFGGVPEFFVEARLARRNMTPSQKAIVAAKLKPVYEKRAKERQKATLKRGGVAPVPATCPERDCNGDARDEAGATHGVSGRSVSRAENVLAAGCKQLIQAVEADRIDVTLAEKVAKAYSGDELAEVVAVAMASEKPAAALKEKVKSEPVAKEFDSIAACDQLCDLVRRRIETFPLEYRPKAAAHLVCVAREYAQ